MKTLFKVAILGVLVIVGIRLLPGAVVVVESLAGQVQTVVQGAVPPMP